MKKRYDVRGMMEWHPVFKVGRGCLQVSFTGGHLCGGACSPATFETSDPAVQTIIEHSREFKDGKITIGMIMEGAAVKMTALHNGAAANIDGPDNLVMMEVGSKAEAEDILTVRKGVPSERLGDFDACAAEARKLGIDLRLKS